MQGETVFISIVKIFGFGNYVFPFPLPKWNMLLVADWSCSLAQVQIASMLTTRDVDFLSQLLGDMLLVRSDAHDQFTICAYNSCREKAMAA